MCVNLDLRKNENRIDGMLQENMKMDRIIRKDVRGCDKSRREIYKTTRLIWEAQEIWD